MAEDRLTDPSDSVLQSADVLTDPADCIRLAEQGLPDPANPNFLPADGLPDLSDGILLAEYGLTDPASGILFPEDGLTDPAGCILQSSDALPGLADSLSLAAEVLPGSSGGAGTMNRWRGDDAGRRNKARWLPRGREQAEAVKGCALMMQVAYFGKIGGNGRGNLYTKSRTLARMENAATVLCFLSALYCQRAAWLAMMTGLRAGLQLKK